MTRSKYSISPWPCSGLTTNLLTKITIQIPTDGAINVPTNTPFQWTGGPSGFDTLSLSKQLIDGSDQISQAAALNATNWPSPPALDPGTNQFTVTYSLANATNFTFSVPVDAYTNSLSNIVTQVSLSDAATSIFTVVSGAAPVQLLDTQINEPTSNSRFCHSPAIPTACSIAPISLPRTGLPTPTSPATAASRS